MKRHPRRPANWPHATGDERGVGSPARSAPGRTVRPQTKRPATHAACTRVGGTDRARALRDIQHTLVFTQAFEPSAASLTFSLALSGHAESIVLPPLLQIEEALVALDTLVRAGDVRYVGLSNWAAWQIMKAIGIARARNLAPITSLQAYYSLVGRDVERELVPLLTAEQVGMMVWSPLAGGYLSGKYADGGYLEAARQTTLDFPPIDRVRGEPLIGVLKEVAIKHGRRPAQVALAWLLKQPVVATVIIGAKRVEQLHENLQAAEVELDSDDMRRLGAASRLPIEYFG